MSGTGRTHEVITLYSSLATRHSPLATRYSWGLALAVNESDQRGRGQGVGRTVGLVHAVIPAIEPLRAAFGELAPDVKLINILDEGLVTGIDPRGSLTPGLV